MKLNTIQRSVLISLLYIGLFIGIVFLQFSKRERFSENSGAILVSGTYSDAQNPGKSFPAELNVSFHGFGFAFGQNLPVSAISSDGGKAIILPLSYLRTARSVSVAFERGVKLNFEASSSGDGFTVSAQFEKPDLASIEFPYTLSNASFREDKDQNLSLKSRNVEYDLSFGSGAKIDSVRHVVALQESDNRLALAAIKAPVKVAALPNSKLPAPLDDKAFQAVVDGYLDRSYRGLKESRFNALQETWSYGPDPARFTEQAFIALIAEAFKRGQFEDLSAKINALAKNKADRLSWKSDVYFGGIVRKTESLASLDAAESARIQKLIQAKDPAVFETPGLVVFAIDRAPQGVSQSLFSLASSIDEKALSLGQAVGYAACMAEAEAFLPGATNPFKAHEGIIESKIQASLSRAEEGYFLSQNGSDVQLETQVRAGAALIALGDLYSEVYKGIGQALTQAALARSDDSGMLPAALVLKDKRISSSSGSLAPETIYSTITDNPWYPREVSLYKQAGAGVWAWTCAPELKYEEKQGQGLITTRFPQNGAHYLTVFGIKPFSMIQIYDIPYSPDSEFESYNVSGYLYVWSTRTLYLKMKHKSEIESVRLTYQ
jgi:hypothetical protein